MTTTKQRRLNVSLGVDHAERRKVALLALANDLGFDSISAFIQYLADMYQQSPGETVALFE